VNTATNRDFSWQRQFIPEMKRIVGEHLISEAPSKEDQEHNTDLIVLCVKEIRVACRVRRFPYMARYGGEFTIRSSRPSGATTEFAKLRSGWGDFLLYGFSSEDESELAQWTLGDLGVFRFWCDLYMHWHQAEPGNEQRNPDGTRFRAFRTRDMPPNFVVASSESISRSVTGLRY
jgi:hypothetical protein